ncbi:MAG: hypothetical protein ACFCVE_14770 [Phycisphaerae bacterium]
MRQTRRTILPMTALLAGLTAAAGVAGPERDLPAGPARLNLADPPHLHQLQLQLKPAETNPAARPNATPYATPYALPPASTL